MATSSSITRKIAFGPNAGKYVTRTGSGIGYGEEIPLFKGKLCATANGFSLHANTAINSLPRDRLSQLIEYIARGPYPAFQVPEVPQNNGHEIQV